MPKKIMKNWGTFHARNILREEVGVFNKLEAGNIVKFNYSGKNSTIKRPLVLVLNPRWHNHLHGIVLEYISDTILLKLRGIIQETVQQKVAKLTSLRLPLLKADIKDPQRFYNSRLKMFIKTYFAQGESPYRLYIVQNIKNLRVIDYRFKDMDISSTGEEDTVRGKTRER